MQSINQDQEILEKEFEGDSDRAAAIVGASYLDELLKELLIQFMVDDSSQNNKALFSGTGPISSFSARINLAYRFGAISKFEKKTLHGIRGIRNEFAHKLSGASFQEESIRQRSINLSIPRELLMPKHIPIPGTLDEKVPLPKIIKASEDDPRAIYQEAVIHIAQLLRSRQIYCSLNKVQECEDYKSATEPAQQVAEKFKNLMERHKALVQKLQDKDPSILDKDPSILEDLKKDIEFNDVMLRTHKFIVEQSKKAHEQGNYA
ncbi:hypothetical protein [Microbulbifer hydrolyticus]|uniref:DNA-binding MltR family transcriptional regulator/DNA-binding transcriptional MerR regulator n=1 Tax=Microbulbifer hydrolyticus TaxID=48074 RepID=A0A6P1TA25_9GAMM|nr:hypothetical protein [Microbulbifer hydrolyticus]MBB5213307.1 DNA-binding MltR family transcriptional regulator/DNA-binding transcriptional MerR regulator [Microbulbifer hydrolyticus]QHQ38605.1 hypothetical protein GTQ55_06125 [Microbulbifer hydrolyticus]